MKAVGMTIIGFCLLATVSTAAEQAVLRDQKARDSYSLGYEFGRNLAAQPVPLDEETLIAAVRDALAARKPLLSEAEISATMKELRRKAFVLQEQRSQELAAKNLEEGKAFLEANRKKEGVVVLPSGLQYRILKKGTGPSPKATDGVRVRFRGTLVNGIEFDNTRALSESELPAVPVSGVMKGWTEALQLMKTGSRWELVIPAELAYGDRRSGRIPPNSVLIFDVELLSVIDKS